MDGENAVAPRLGEGRKGMNLPDCAEVAIERRRWRLIGPNHEDDRTHQRRVGLMGPRCVRVSTARGWMQRDAPSGRVTGAVKGSTR
jgi:hypothetical protein